MTPDPIAGLFVVGTDTGVGKTFVASAIVRQLRADGHRAGVLKPVASGCRIVGDRLVSEDAETLAAAFGGLADLARINPITYVPPLAPPVAARLAGELLSTDRVLAATFGALRWWAGAGGADLTVIEGVGGLLCPLAEGMTVADLAVAVDFPILIVARRGLGTLNHVLLTVEAANWRGLRVAGIVLNQAEPSPGDELVHRTNVEELARRVEAPILAVLDNTEAGASLCRSFDLVDWKGLTARPRRPWPSPIDGPDAPASWTTTG